MDTLKSMSQASIITRADLPSNVTAEAFDKLFNDLKNKVENNTEAAGIALNDLGTTWNVIQHPISDDSAQLLKGLLNMSGEHVSETEAKWKAVLSNILEKDNSKKENKLFTEQEEVFIATMMGIQNCDGGKAAGIASSYELLDSKYRYQINLSKPLSAMDEETESKKIKAVAFLKEFMKGQPIDASTDAIAEKLVKHVNENLNELSIIIVPWIEDDSFWTEEYALNKLGALELLKIVNKEEIKSVFSQPISQAIQKLITSQFSGTNALMKELTKVDDIKQGSHLSIYLKNLIGHLVGVSQNVTFDRHTTVLYDELVVRDRDNVLALFFKYVTPEVMVNEITRVFNDDSGEITAEAKSALKIFLPDDKFWNGTSLTKLGALELLRTLEFVA